MKKNILVIAILALLPAVMAGTEEKKGVIVGIGKQPGSRILDMETLAKLPTGRNLTSILQMVPGLTVDRSNVGGNDAGPQFQAWGFGTTALDTVWLVDGKNVTDYSRPGSPPSLGDMDLIEEISVTTGGTEAIGISPGAVINVITKSGTGEFRGTGHLYTAPFALGRKPTDDMVDAGLNYPKGRSPYDLGLSLGGPILKDKVWFFGSFALAHGRTENECGATATDTSLAGFGKITFDLPGMWGKPRGSFHFGFDSDRKSGLSTISPGQQDSDSLSDVVQPRTLFSGNVKGQLGKWGLNLRGFLRGSGKTVSSPGAPLDSGTGQSRGTEFKFVDGSRLEGSSWYQKVDSGGLDLALDGNYFLEGVLGGDHEIRFGVDYYTADTTTQTLVPNQRIAYVDRQNPANNHVLISPDSVFESSIGRTSFYIQDTVNFGKLTATLGLRYDMENWDVKPFDLPAFTWYEPGSPYDGQQVFPTLIPYSSKKFDFPFSWQLISPRIALTYDITGDGKNVARLSAGRYLSSSGADMARTYAPVRQGWIPWNDQNGDEIPQFDELYGLLKTPYYPEICPETYLQPTGIDSDYSTPYLDELTAMFERALTDDLSVSLTAFLKAQKNLTHYYNSAGQYVPYSRGLLFNGLPETRDNWQQAGTVDVGGTSVPYYVRKQKPIGRYFENLKNSSLDYLGFQLMANKKLSNRWAANASFTYQNWVQSLDPDDIVDPNNFDFFDGGAVAPLSDGFGYGTGFNNSRWVVQAAGLYQFPGGINVGGTFQAREGNPAPVRTPVLLPQGLTYFYPAGQKLGDERLPTFWMLNLGLEKTLKVSDTVQATVVVDWYNVTNNQIELRRNINIGANPTATPDPTMWSNAGLFQFGVRVDF